jgi:hypothetical protein
MYTEAPHPVKASLKFVQLYQTEDGEEDADENREGLRMLQKYGVRLDVMKGRDWQFLLQTLTRKSAKKRQNACNMKTRERLRELLQNPRSVMTNTDPPEEKMSGSSSSEDEDDE